MVIVSGKLPNLAAAKEIKLVLYTNPTAAALTGYRTMIPGAAVAEKLNGGMDDGLVRVIDVGTGLVVPHWGESYGAGPADAKVWHKISPDANKVEPIIIYDVPPSPAPPDGGGGAEDDDDPDHKKVVTDITPTKGHTIYLLFAGGATPAGYDLVSGAGGYFADKFPVGNKVGIVATSDTSAPEYAGIVCSNQVSDANHDAVANTGGEASQWTMRTHNHNTDSANLVCNASDAKPVYKTLKMVRVHKIKAMIPKDTIIIFDDAVPTGFTRYAAQDGNYVRCAAVVGAGGGNATRTFAVNGVTETKSPGHTDWNADGNDMYTLPAHSHTFNKTTAAVNNFPPTQNIILGQADNDLAYIPAGAILMFDETPPIDDWEVVAALKGKMLKGNAAYNDGGGTETVTPTQLVGNTSIKTSSYGFNNAYVSNTFYSHHHILTIDFDPVTTYPACRQVVFAKARHQIDDDGYEANIIASDVVDSRLTAAYTIYSNCGRHIAVNNKGLLQGVLHAAYTDGASGTDHAYHAYSINGGENWTPERIDVGYAGNQISSDLVIDANGNVHFVWAEYDVGDANHRQIMYRRLSSAAVWGAVETVSQAGNPFYQMDPCIQVKNDGETIGVVWVGQGWGAGNNDMDVAYRERTGAGVWDIAETHITANAAAGFDYRHPALDYDLDDYPHVVYDYLKADWTTLDVYYNYEIGAGWQAQEHVNNDGGDAGVCSTNSNILLDKDNNIHVAYLKVSLVSPYLHTLYYKNKARGGAWGAKEEVLAATVAEGARAPQIQLDGTGQVYCTYARLYDAGGGNFLVDGQYKVRSSGGVWGAAVIVMQDTCRMITHIQMLWSRLPLKDGIYQTWSQQHVVWVFVRIPIYDSYVGNIEFKADPTTVIGDIDDPVTTETYRFRQRGAICRQKINHGKVTPYAIG